MTEGSITERRIRPIQEAIRANNWKQALKECEKWQKKGEASDRFLVRAYGKLSLTSQLNFPDIEDLGASASSRR